MSEQRKVSGEGFILHSYPYRETSMLIDVFSRGHGRLSMVARGAKRPRSSLRGVLLSFQPLLLAWYGRGEVRTLARAEWIGGLPLLRGEALLCGFYLNELLLRLLPKEDPHEELFEQYRKALERLAVAAPSAPILRAFEKVLLKELGYALTLDRDVGSGRKIDPGGIYVYDPERGPLELDGAAGGEPRISGRTLMDLERDDFSNPVTLQEAKALMRMVIGLRLGSVELRSRRIFKELLEL